LSDFFAEVERRAYKQALFAVRDDHQALDIVQDAMLKLTERYSGNPATELPLLFQRILQNTIRDFYRRQKVRALWTTPISSLFGADADPDADPLETLEVQDDSKFSEPPAEQLERSQVKKRCSCCRHVNARPFCCVTGRNWTLLPRQKSWAARRGA
jgi:RNA polymerase sigma-70 factor (ECF subfamily)